MTLDDRLALTQPAVENGEKPQHIIIAGPCSAETEDQVTETARQLADAGITYFRAGVWKPRTSPDSFEGVGAAALAWLKRVQHEFGLKIAIEVANARHVEAALKSGIDLLWIGARTSVNPFTVQEIADALRGSKIPVMVKNPVNPDLGLWKGAIERILRSDVGEVMACHRGFNVYGKSLFRNAPLWEIPIELKREYPQIPLICDPSHISGSRKYIPEIARKALNLGYEGLMIETHHDPDNAWSDAAQQLTPAAFKDLITHLQWRQHSTDNPGYQEQVAILRNAIDEADNQLLGILAERMELSKRIGSLKEENNIAFYQHNRWTAIIEHVKEYAKQHQLNEEFALKLFSLIHLESIDIQGE